MINNDELFLQLQAASTSCGQIADQWDVVIIGAGPAGALCAILLAQANMRTLLVDKSPFPRHKVCGSCLSSQAIKTLEQCGLGALPSQFGSIPLEQLHISSPTHTIKFPLTQSRSLSRKVLDSALTQIAIAKEAVFVPRTHATLATANSDFAIVNLKDKSSERQIKAKLVIAADGVSGNAISDRENLETFISHNSKVGVGAISKQAPDSYTDGTIFMAYGKGGYVGLVRIEDGSTNIAAALTTQFLKNAGTTSTAICKMLSEARLPLPADIEQIDWKGTMPLTRRRKSLSSTRLFIIGDSASYVEPFTGEGIAWAFTSAKTLIPLALQAIESWHPSMSLRWNRMYAQTVARQQANTKLLTSVLGHTHLANIAAEILTKAPCTIAPIARAITE